MGEFFKIFPTFKKEYDSALKVIVKTCTRDYFDQNKILVGKC